MEFNIKILVCRTVNFLNRIGNYQTMCAQVLLYISFYDLTWMQSLKNIQSHCQEVFWNVFWVCFSLVRYVGAGVF